MIPVEWQDHCLTIQPVAQDQLDAVLNVYQQCEDFLALGPVATATMEMVHNDLENSKNNGGIFCGIHTADGTMIGVLDYVPNGYQGKPQTAELSLLMIASPYRNQGIGEAVVEAFEKEIKQDARVTVIFSGVQVNNPKAMRFWHRLGYLVVSEPKSHPDQTIAVDLQKDLK